MPLWGTCAGLILLASEVTAGLPGQPLLGLLDAQVERNAFGRQVDSFEADLEVPALGKEPFHAVFIRAPLPRRLGPGVEVLASHEGAPVAVRQGLTMRVETDPAVPMLEIDRTLLRQAILNLVKNGLEALSHGGELTIGSRATEHGVEVIVADTGPGIPIEVGERLFEQFFTTKPQGTGLGLSISRQIIEEHGGDVDRASMRELIIRKIRRPSRLRTIGVASAKRRCPASTRNDGPR